MTTMAPEGEIQLSSCYLWYRKGTYSLEILELIIVLFSFFSYVKLRVITFYIKVHLILVTCQGGY